MGRERFSREFEFIKNWDKLPDDAVVSIQIAAFFLGVSKRTILYHPQLMRTRVQLSENRYGYRVGDVRKIARGGFKEIAA
jgi:hypothetical protein